MTKSQFDEYLYNRLPKIYREFDKDFTLKHFLSMCETELGVVMKDTQDLLDLIDVDKCPIEYIPLLCETLGVNYEPDIDINFQRRFLKNAVMLNKRKGTMSAIQYLSRELFGKEVIVTLDKRKIIIEIDGSGGDLGVYGEKRVLERYIKYYIPVTFELESVFHLDVKPAKVNVNLGMMSGDVTYLYPKIK